MYSTELGCPFSDPPLKSDRNPTAKPTKKQPETFLEPDGHGSNPVPSANIPIDKKTLKRVVQGTIGFDPQPDGYLNQQAK